MVRAGPLNASIRTAVRLPPVKGQTMDLKHFQRKLLEKKRECEASLAAFQSEETVAGEAEVRDSTDDATAAQSTSETFGEGTLVSQTLEAVEDALQRIKDGTYGKCAVWTRD
jgi:RNA polymerase-binding transcription factor DksA